MRNVFGTELRRTFSNAPKPANTSSLKPKQAKPAGRVEVVVSEHQSESYPHADEHD